MIRYGHESTGFVSFPWGGLLLIAVCSLFLSACSTLGDQSEIHKTGDQSMAFGMIDIKAIGPNPRQFPIRLRFFDVVHVSTRERTRVMVKPETQTFSVHFKPGRYEVIRLQISEGPFMAESSLRMTFQIRANQLSYLGKWELNVDTPRTQRMVRMEVTENGQNWKEIFEAHPILKGKSVVNALPELTTHQARMYVVAPIPKVKYFYRQ